MRFWRWLRQSDEIEMLELALDAQTKLKREAEAASKEIATQLDVERSRRIAYESIATERRAELDRQIAQFKEMQEAYETMLRDRMKSLDSLNVKLMETRTEAPPPDLKQFRVAEQAATQAVRKIRQSNSQVDIALLTKLHPRFQKVAGAVMNEVSAAHTQES